MMFGILAAKVHFLMVSGHGLMVVSSKLNAQRSKFKVLGAKILFFDEFLGDFYIIALDLDEINA